MARQSGQAGRDCRRIDVCVQHTPWSILVFEESLACPAHTVWEVAKSAKLAEVPEWQTAPIAQTTLLLVVTLFSAFWLHPDVLASSAKLFVDPIRSRQGSEPLGDTARYSSCGSPNVPFRSD